jgi:diguanylate cyclase (GGDEF)-like protein
VPGLAVTDIAKATANGLVVKDRAGKAVFGLVWVDRQLGSVATASAKTKSAMVLGFLMLVMGGIAFVCWRLIQNITDNEQRAIFQALHDPLTELPNRAAMIDKLKSLTKSEGSIHAVAFADLDGFKEVNDSFGHNVGDRLLRAVGAGISRLSSNSAFASRMGGDEFVVLFTGENAVEQASEFAGHLLHFLAKPFDIDGRVAFVGASVGIAGSKGNELDELEILRRADIAMYKAKGEGKNRSCVYEASFDAERAESQGIAAELMGILGQSSIEIAFQPVISTRTMQVSGVEALARWPQTSKRQLSPDRFVAVAESAGLIDELGEQILDKACAAAKEWPDLRLAVNISATQLNNPRFVQRSMAIIEKHGIPTRRIEFEITETSLIRDAGQVKQVFRELQRYGIKIALDDFGTGFSSIGYLRTFNFDRIKLDKSIVSKVLTSPAELAVVQGVLLVARGLSAEVTAEGVEREEEVAVLRLAGCTELQGFHFHKPMEAKGVTALLERGKLAAQRLAG